MPESVSVIVFVAVFFAAMILRLATSQGFSSKLTGWLVVIAAFGGFIFYGYAYAQHESDPFLAVIRALLSVCDMFTGSVDENAIDYAKLNTNPPSLILFWLIHLMALYATASATISVIGAEALRKLRLWFSHWGDLYIIYSATTESVEFGHKLVGTKKHPLVFVDPAPSSGVVNGINKSGFLLRSDSNALLANKHFAKSIGIRRKRKITLYAIGKDGAQNLSYAKAFLDTLQQLHVQPENTRLLILGVNEYIAMDLQSTDQSYGYGAVSHIKESELAARVLINLYHPSQTIQFNTEGMAQENFHALVIGFGQMGQNVLKQLIINGQFYGSKFRCDVFDPNTNAISKFLPPQIQQRYQITFHNSAANIEELDTFLSSNLNSLKYIVICTGSDEANSKLALEIALCCMHKQVQIPIYQCSRESITQTTVNLSRCQSTNAAWFDTDDLDPGTLRSQKTSLYDPWFMCFDSSDILAMRIHKSYFRTAQNELQLWMILSHFLRVSNRSAADYLTALFHAVGIAQNGQLCTATPPEGSLLENLAHSEHLRWCAFHFCHGYTAMSMDEFEERARICMKEVEECGKSSIRITKNNVARTHACLISWDELDYLSQRESCITRKPINYKEFDINNILTVWQTMKTLKAVLWPYRK